MVIDRFEQQPREIRAKQIDYSQFLVDDTLDDLAPIVIETERVCGNVDDTATPFEIVNASFVSTTVIGYFAQGGASGNQYKATFLVDTVNGQRHEAEIIFTIKEI